ncbi:MAG: hypothetical protein ACK59M_11845 [Pseudomonadota bacterium]|jgi:hypothetical protein
MRIVTFFVVLAVADAAAAAVGKFDPAGRDRTPLDAYPVLVVRDLADAVEKRAEGDRAAAFADDVKAGGARFAAKLAEKLTADPALQRQVVRDAPAGAHAVVEGRIVDFHDGNLAQRYIGLGGRDRFGAVVEVKDGATGELLGTIEIDLKGSLIPGAGNLIQSTGNFIEGAAARVRDELLIAAGDKRRENTGRQGRLREKYAAGN